MSETGFQPPFQHWNGHPESPGRLGVCLVVLVVIWTAFGVSVALWGWWGLPVWLGLIVAAGVLWGGWSYVLEGWDWLRARWSR